MTSKENKITSIFGICCLVSTILSANTALGEVTFDRERDFVIAANCDATTSIRDKTNPTPVKPEDTFQAFSLNKDPGATHVRIRVDGKLKWIALTCGRFAKSDAMAPAAETCLPFFDNEENLVPDGFGGRADITPPAPEIEPFDEEVLKVCGKAGKVVGESEFKSLMRKNIEVLKRVHAFTEGEVFAGRLKPGDLNAYLDDLTEAWFAVKAFDHIYCGEPAAGSGNGIGGLHFHGRYLQLQKSAEACRRTNFGQNEVIEGVIYTMGVRMKNADGRFVTKPKSGYGLTLSAEDLLKTVTLAFLQNPTQSSSSQGCLLDIRDDGKQFKAVFVRRSTGIRTFFPDATPNGPTERQNPQCNGAIDLQ